MQAENDMLSMRRYPSLAALKTLRLAMHPVEATLWLLSTSAAVGGGGRLKEAEHAEVSLYGWLQDEPTLVPGLPVAPEAVSALLSALGKACPNLESLRADTNQSQNWLSGMILHAFFNALDAELPGGWGFQGIPLLFS